VFTENVSRKLDELRPEDQSQNPEDDEAYKPPSEDRPHEMQEFHLRNSRTKDE
jgi:hypothetical protein